MGADLSHPAANQSEVFAFLSEPRSHGITEPVIRIDTHGAAVFLAGTNVYKVKRAVRFPFLDYSTLEKRRTACEAEVAINRPYAPSLYLGIVPIRRGRSGLTLDGEGEPFEWAVHMRRFDVTATLDRIAETGALPRSLITKLTRAVLRSHERAPLREGAPFVDGLERYIRENKAGLTEASDLFHADQVAQVTAHSLERLASAKNLLLARGAQGFVRRCHGDLHLGNVVVLEGEPTLFDAIEFDEAIATCDVLYDLAFLLMDLWARGLHENANLVFNRYLWESDQANLSGLAPVPLFLATRASIRAKVVAARLVHLRDSERDRAAADAAQYVRCAKDVLKAVRPRFVAVGGLSGAGKSTLAAALAPYLGPPPGAVHLRSDIERKRMFGVAETGPLPAKAYQPHVTRDVYDLLLRKAALVLGSGCSVVIDAVHAHEEERRCTEVLARDFGLPFIGLWLEGDPELLLQRVSNRSGDASDANAEVVKKQVKIDVGRMNWHRLNAAAPITQTLAAVRHILDDQ